MFRQWEVDFRILETKSAMGHLAAKYLMKKNGRGSGTRKCGIESDSTCTVQPVLQLIFTGQLAITISTYIITSETRRVYVRQANDRLILRGCVLVVIVLRLCPSGLSKSKEVPTKFMSAIEASCKLTDCSYLKSTQSQVQ